MVTFAVLPGTGDGAGACNGAGIWDSVTHSLPLPATVFRLVS